MESPIPQPTDDNDEAAKRAAIGQLPLAEVGHRAIRQHLKRIRKRLGHLEEGNAVEAIHKLRVTTRALRATLEVLEETPAFDAKRLQSLRRRLRRLTRTLGEVRDLDVFLGRVAAFEGQDALQRDEGGLQPLRDSLTERRQAADARLQRELHRGRTRRLLRDLHNLAQESLDADQSNETPPVLVRHVAGSAIWRRYEAVLAFEALMPDATTETLHALRITCKHLRYILELFDTAEQHSMLALLQSTQDYLGTLHDDAVALATIEEVRATHPEATALFIFAETITGERDTLCRGVAPHWENLISDATRLQLAQFIAAL